MGILDQVATPDDVNRDDPDVLPMGATQPTTTVEAQHYARKILDPVLSGQSQSEDEDLIRQIETNADVAKKALREAQAKLLGSQAAPTPQELAYKQAAAWFAPTQTGRFSESIGNYADERAKELAAERKFNADQAMTGLDLNSKMSDIDSGTLQSKLALQKLHEQQQGALAGHALAILGRGVSPKGVGAVAVSTAGKQAVDEGLAPGTPQYMQRVHEIVQAGIDDAAARAGKDTTPDDPEQKAELASQYGVPADVSSPWAGKSTRERMAGEQIEQRDATKKLSTYADDDSNAQAALRDLEKFQQINAVTHTGPELSRVAIGGIHAGLHGVGAEAGGDEGWSVNPFNWFAGFKPNIQEMNKIAANLTATAIPPKGFGRVTNKDIGIFQQGMVGVDKSKEANDSIAQALKIRLQNDLDRHEFMQNFYTVHGHLRGAAPAWNEYLDNNPIFDPNNKTQGHAGIYTLNPARLKYTDYFRAKNEGRFKSAEVPTSAPAGQLPNVTEDMRNDPVNAGLSDQDILDAQRPAKARGGRIGFDDGGSVSDALEALRSGATLKLSPGQENKESPASNFALEGAGATGAAGALLALSRLRGRLGPVGRALGAAGRFAIDHPTVAASGAGATAGAIAGGAGTRDTDPTFDALAGGVTGAALGPLARFGVSRGVGGAGQLLDRLRGQVVGSGDRRVIEAISSDNPNWNSVAGQLRTDARNKIPSTLGDAVGPRTRGLATAALAKDTPETATYADALQQRQEGATGRVMDQTNAALKPDNYLTETEKLKSALYSNAKPLYEQAYQQFPAVQSPALYKLMTTPSGQEAAARAFRMMQDMRLPIGSPDATGMVQNPSLQYLDQVKRALDDMVNREEGTGLNYQSTNQGRVLRQMRDELRSGIDQATQGANGQPGPYQLARQQYAGDLEVVDALRSGREDFSKLTPDELRAKVASMSFAEKDAFRSGVAEGLFQRANNTTETQNPAKRVISTPALQEKLTALFDKPAEAGKYLANLQREADMFDASQGMIRTADKGQLDAFKPSSIARLARTTMMGKDTAGDISNTLSTSSLDPTAQSKIDRLRAAADRLKNRSDFGNLAGVAGGAGLATAVTPTDAPNQGSAYTPPAQ